MRPSHARRHTGMTTAVLIVGALIGAVIVFLVVMTTSSSPPAPVSCPGGRSCAPPTYTTPAPDRRGAPGQY